MAASVALAAASCNVAAAAVPADPLPAEQLVAAPQGNYLWARWQAAFNRGVPTLWPDATVRSFDNASPPSGPLGPGIFAAVDPNGSGAVTVPPTDGGYAASTDDGPPPGSGSLTGRRGTTSQDRLWGRVAIGIAGRNWNVQAAVEDQRSPLVASDEALRPIAVRRRVSADEVVPTAAGLRLVTARYTRYDRLGNRALRGTQVTDARGRQLAYIRGFRPTGSAVDTHGSLLVIGQTSARRKPLAVVGVRASGRASVHRLRGIPSGARYAAVAYRYPSVLQTARGPVIALRTARSELTLGRVSPTGAVSGVHTLATMGLPWPAGCLGAGVQRTPIHLAVGSDGRPLVGIKCVRDSTGFTNVLFGLDASLRFASTVAVETGGQLTNTGWATAPLPDGRLLVSRGDGALSAVRQPAALAPALGKVTRLKAGGDRKALVRIECRRPYGAVCSGLVQVTSKGAFLGWAPYALPGRPGRARTAFDLTVPLWPKAPAPPGGRLPAGAVAALTPLPAHFDRGGPTPPPNPPLPPGPQSGPFR